eukprot:TRINITY_DN76366_c0_g1_i1.p1 TRINITY_DN76366_c0_g1~~TRINITY_DN76366_c0_g1_i1.p1  ORF type:complete len:146 (-),score=4.89 TRINITY_DN76366_c0_g1_i1:320-757(-)
MPGRSSLPVLLLLIVAVQAKYLNWTSCGGTAIKVLDVFMEPYPLRLFHKWNIGYDLITQTNIADGHVKVKVQYGDLPPFAHSVNICDKGAEKDGYPPCPIPRGTKFRVNDTNPGPIFKGTYHGTFTQTWPNGTVQFCVKTSWEAK